MTKYGTGLITPMHRAPSRTGAVLGLLAYLLAAAILPPGHMAAPLAAGGPFHLCPGDARSVLILSALPGVHAPGDTGLHAEEPSQHHAHGTTAPDATAAIADGPAAGAGAAHGDAAAAAEPRFDAGCASAGGGAAVVASAEHDLADPVGGGVFPARPPESPVTPARWLRPAPRSPPA